jgi:hypothetical protein
VNKLTKFAAVALVGAAAVTGLSACQSDKDVASKNLSTEADSFNVQRKIIGVNTRTDKYLFYVEGKCAIDREGDLVITCKHGDNDYRKHYIGQANDVAWVVTQEAPMDVSVYHTKIVIKPENLLPELELSTGKQ